MKPQTGHLLMWQSRGSYVNCEWHVIEMMTAKYLKCQCGKKMMFKRGREFMVRASVSGNRCDVCQEAVKRECKG